MTLVSSIDQGFCAIPISPFNKYDCEDFMLNLLENYLLKLQFYKDTKAKTLNDFGNMV